MADVQEAPAGGANSGTKGKQRAGCPPVGSAVQSQRDGARYWQGDEGVQPETRRVALATVSRGAPFSHGGSVCFYRLGLGDGLQDGRQ